MKKDKSLRNIKMAFLLNLLFSIIELFGGLITNSISIITDSIHDFGDALSIGIAMFLEKKSKNKPNKKYTFGYLRFSILGAFITSTILIVGSVFVFVNAIPRLFNPEVVNYNGMIILGVVGIIINLIATVITSKTKNKNEKLVSLHMLEDVLGWVAVLIGAFLIKLFDLYIVDPILSILIALFILVNVIKQYKGIFEIFLEKNVNIEYDEISNHLLKINGVKGIHHIHLWTLDGINNYVTLHVLIDNSLNLKDLEDIKCKIKNELKEHNVLHSTIEFEINECNSLNCNINELESKEVMHNH